MWVYEVRIPDARSDEFVDLLVKMGYIENFDVIERGD